MIARVRVLENRRETPTIRTVRFTRPAGFEFRPVQFVGLEIQTAEGSEEYSMSLASSPTRDYLEFGARISDSPWKRAFAALAPGDEAEIDGPYGHFVLDEARPAVFVAGGVGITPLRGMIQYATDRALPIDLVLVYSNRTPDEIAYRGELEGLAEKNPRLRIVHTITRPKGLDGWADRTGRIDSALLREAGRPTSVYYLCGAPAMVEAAFRMLRALGVPEDRIVYEAFWGYE